jgi:hypothetical protein
MMKQIPESNSGTAFVERKLNRKADSSDDYNNNDQKQQHKCYHHHDISTV